MHTLPYPPLLYPIQCYPSPLPGNTSQRQYRQNSQKSYNTEIRYEQTTKDNHNNHNKSMSTFLLRLWDSLLYLCFVWGQCEVCHMLMFIGKWLWFNSTGVVLIIENKLREIYQPLGWMWPTGRVRCVLWHDLWSLHTLNIQFRGRQYSNSNCEGLGQMELPYRRVKDSIVIRCRPMSDITTYAIFPQIVT